MVDANKHSVPNFTASNNQPGFHKAISDNRAVGNVIPTRNGPGLLDIPPEVRIMIFRLLLLNPHGLPLPYKPIPSRSLPLRLFLPGSRPSVAILRTCSVIYREAFDILYRENLFSNCFLPLHNCSPIPHVMGAIQNILIEITLSEESSDFKSFLKQLNLFGNPAVVRGTLMVDFFIEDPRIGLLKWFIRALGRFTNFKIIELQCCHRDDSIVFHLREYLESALKPVLGYAHSFGDEGTGLRFHPMEHKSLRRQSENVDWADFLDGIRLEWNGNVTNPDKSEMSAENKERDQGSLLWSGCECVGFLFNPSVGPAVPNYIKHVTN